MQDDANAGAGADRRKEPRLPEELLAVMTDNIVASELIESLPEGERLSKGQWVAEADTRSARARRAVDVVRDAIVPTDPAAEDPHS